MNQITEDNNEGLSTTPLQSTAALIDSSPPDAVPIKSNHADANQLPIIIVDDSSDDENSKGLLSVLCVNDF
jgi:hypothetical protein